VSEVADFKELVLLCTKKIDTEGRVIQIQGKPSISLAPLVFKRMLRLTDPTLTFKNVEVDDFLKDHNKGM
jgi:hypothetical protein